MPYQAEKPPSVVFIIDDQHRHDAISYLGHPAVRTPNIDALAADGTCYTQAVCNTPACVPSRHSFITGAYPMQTRVLSNHHMWLGESELPTLADLLTAAGYRTAAFGKMHWNKTKSRHGFELRAADDFYGDIEGPLDISYSKDRGEKAVAARMENWKHFKGDTRLTGGQSSIPLSEFDDTWCFTKAKEYLESVDDSSPFFLISSFLKPHPPNFVPAEYFGKHDAESMASPDSPEERPPASFQDSEPGFPRARLSPQEWKQVRARYFENVEYVDSLVGELVDTLKDKGQYNDSLICFFSDHGEMLGNRGGGNSKFTLYESSVRVPLIVKYPHQTKEPEISDRLAELVDLAPTCLSLAGLEIPAHMPGQNLLTPPKREFQFAENYLESDRRVQWMIRTSRYKLILRESGGASMYDLETDPWEYKDLWANRQYLEIRQDLEQSLYRHVMSVTRTSAQKNHHETKREGPLVVLSEDIEDLAGS